MVTVQVGQEDGIYVLRIDPRILEIDEQLAACTHGLRTDAGVYQHRALRGTQHVSPDASAQGVAVSESPRVSVQVRLPLILHNAGEDLVELEESPLDIR